ncbi:MAG TPA: glycosyltransferase family 2 protein [Thermodesulfobacteriota bacterium]|nr:glycosyltransferase family 2 protein [Thermodesulfobacteriota bacterium]
MSPHPLLSVIIPNWNGRRFLEECIDSLKGQTFQDFETILVDNGSADGSAEFAQERYGEFLRILRNKENLGFAGGNNVGIRMARGEYIVLLNNDTTADPRWLEALIKAARFDPSIGMWGSKVCSYAQRDRIDGIGELIYWDGLCRARGQYEKDRGDYVTEEIFFPQGCGAMYRKSLFDGIGLFDEDFFAYADDSDIGIRARLAGWKCLFVPSAVIYHKSSGTAGQHSALKAFYVERNRFWLTIKYFPSPLLFLSLFFTLYRFAFQAYGALTHRGAAGRFTEIHSPLELVVILLKAYGSGIRLLPRMWKKRRMLRPLRKVSYGEIFSWFKRFGISAKEISLRL